MHKKLKIPILLIILILILILILIFTSPLIVRKNIKAQTNSGSVNLILDSLTKKDEFPKEFRKTTDLSIIKDNKNLNLKGIDKLNISGSQQFSEYNLPLLVNAIGTSLPITIVDLRQESHGFINGLPVSWADSKNNANVGLTREQVLLDESNKLKSIKLNEAIIFSNAPNETIIPVKDQNEEELVKSSNLLYNRITVRDGGIPDDDMVDYFIKSIKEQAQDSWLHFHCKAGAGRTTTFMIMYDMIKNYKDVSAEEIIKRQLALANFDEKAIKSFENKERMNFLDEFYDYLKVNGDSLKMDWSRWKQIYTHNSTVNSKLSSVLRVNSNSVKYL